MAFEANSTREEAILEALYQGVLEGVRECRARDRERRAWRRLTAAYGCALAVSALSERALYRRRATWQLRKAVLAILERSA